MTQKKIIKLTSYKGVTILIGLDSIIEVTPTTLSNGNGVVSKIVSRGAMVSTNWVKETVEEIYYLANSIEDLATVSAAEEEEMPVIPAFGLTSQQLLEDFKAISDNYNKTILKTK